MGFVTTAAEIIAFLASRGYRKETGRGRHGVKMVNGSIRIPVITHKRDIATGTARGMLAQAGYSPDDLMEWRNKR
jgi:predicted RNA binding protein YcfA (HicA-like mRNA interferase family)